MAARSRRVPRKGFGYCCSGDGHLFGLHLGGIVMGSSVPLLLVIYLPVVGQLCETHLRKDTYQEQDHHHVYG